MTEENSGSRENVRHLGKFIRHYFEEIYETEKEKSRERQARMDKFMAPLGAWWEKASPKERNSAQGIYYLSKLTEKANDASHIWHLSLMAVLAEAFEGLTRNMSVEDNKELAEHLEALTRKADEEKQGIDKHFAKRMNELFGKDGKGYIA
jgi:hypothetical protein